MPNDTCADATEAAESRSTGQEARQSALERFERTAHQRCCDCGRFVPKEYRVTPLAEQRKDPNASIAHPVCARCRREYDPPEW